MTGYRGPNGARLTMRQQAILDFIMDSIKENGFPPTIRAIATRFGISSPHGVDCHLKSLAKKGRVELIPGVSRGIRIRGVRWQPVTI